MFVFMCVYTCAFLFLFVFIEIQEQQMKKRLLTVRKRKIKREKRMRAIRNIMSKLISVHNIRSTDPRY